METAEDRRVASFLVRFWLEPREANNLTSPVRGYVRHLQTGDEQYFSDMGMLVEYVLHQLPSRNDEGVLTIHPNPVGNRAEH